MQNKSWSLVVREESILALERCSATEKNGHIMETITLGRTGIETTSVGLGSGGGSRIGMFSKGIDHAASIVRLAYDNGVRFFDTADVYGTQPAVGKGLEGLPRDSFVISTKYPFLEDDDRNNPKNLEAKLDKALSELKTDYVDIYHMHGIMPEDYPRVKEYFYPELLQLRDKGKLRFIGITERFIEDTSHEMAALALADNLFDVMMLGYNLINSSAKSEVLATAKAQGVGTLCMFAVRNALSDRAYERELLQKLIDSGQVQAEDIDLDEGLMYLVNKGYAASIMEAAYRFCNYTDGIDITLFGTSSPDHLKENLSSFTLPPLPDEALEWIQKVFGKVDSVSGH